MVTCQYAGEASLTCRRSPRILVIPFSSSMVLQAPAGVAGDIRMRCRRGPIRDHARHLNRRYRCGRGNLLRAMRCDGRNIFGRKIFRISIDRVAVWRAQDVLHDRSSFGRPLNGLVYVGSVNCNTHEWLGPIGFHSNSDLRGRVARPHRAHDSKLPLYSEWRPRSWGALRRHNP
jgi:hypothetical protein